MNNNDLSVAYLTMAEIQSKLYKAKIYSLGDLEELLNSSSAKDIQKRAKLRELEAAKARVRQLENEVYSKI